MSAAVVVCMSAGVCSAAFPPSKYAIYQLSRIDSLYTDNQGNARAIVPSVKSAANGTDLRLLRVETSDLTDATYWTYGPPWLLPDDDTVGYAVRFSGRRMAYLSISNAPLHTFGFDVYYNELDSLTELFACSYVAPAGYPVYFHHSSVSVDPAGRIVFFRDMGNQFRDTLHLAVAPPGEWIPVVIQVSLEDTVRYLSLFVTDSCAMKLRIGPAPGGTYSSITFFGSGREVLCGNIAHFEGATGGEVYSNYMKWSPVEDDDCADTMVIPMVVHQILYDPPGDGSVSILGLGNTITGQTVVSEDYRWGASVFFGYELSVSIGAGFISADAGGLDVEFTIKSDFCQSKYQSFDTRLELNQQFSTSVDGALASCIGPGGGDIVVFQSQTLERRLYKRPTIITLEPSHDSCYTYFVMHRMLPDTLSRLRVARVSDLLGQIAGDSAATALLKSAYAIDPATGRVRRDLIDSGRRLAKLSNNWDFSGNIPITSTETRGGTYTSSSTFTWGVGASVYAKLMFFGRKAGADGYFDYSRQSGSENSTDSSLTISYTLSDDESWDRFAVDVYYDSLHRTYVFDVDSSLSYASFPFEDRYARRAVDCQVAGSDTLQSGLAGDVLEYKVAVSVVSPSAVTGLPDPLTVLAEVLNYPHQSSVLPQEVKVALAAVETLTVRLSSPDTGSFSGLLRVSLVHPAGGDAVVARDIPLRSVFQSAVQGVYIGCETAAYLIEQPQDPASHRFSLSLRNVGERSATIETGVSSVSEGVNYQLGSFANPVPGGEWRNVSVTLTCTGNRYPFSATVWAMIQGEADTYRELVLSVDTGAVGIDMDDPRVRYGRAQRQLTVVAMQGRGLVLYVPGPESATVRILDLAGRELAFLGSVLGECQWSIDQRADRRSPCVLLVRITHRGMTIVKRVVLAQ